MPMRHLIGLLLTIVLLCSAALADLPLAQDTVGQQLLAQYLQKVNEDLLSVGNAPINSVFMCFPGVASVGITQEDMAEVPENVELSFLLYPSSLNMVEVRASDPDLFGVIAAACIQAASPDELTMKDALKQTQPYVKKVKGAPGNSFEDTVIEMNGTNARTYFAYYPNQYHDQVNWLQMTLIFPLNGYDGGVVTTPTPSVYQPEDEYEGIDVNDGYTHFEVFVTATPEPDSPAGESDLGL